MLVRLMVGARLCEIVDEGGYSESSLCAGNCYLYWILNVVNQA
jgi:hypothetical protein